MTTESDQLIEEATEMFRTVKNNLSEKSQSLILTRIMHWQKQQQLALRNTQAQGPHPVFVMRPGLPPRPLDPFYFKLTDSYKD